MMIKGKIIATSISKSKGVKKKNVPMVELRENFGVLNDAHAGSGREVSFLAIESIEKIRKKGLDVGPGDFAENITTKDIDLLTLNIGDRVKIGKDAVLAISQIGKECHTRCAIYYQAGDCVMPTEGIFATVLKAGVIRPGDEIVATQKKGESNV